ncbi:MAG: ATP-binding protein [archaeon]|nr:ATP-binding protein [archaeon]
MANKKGQKVAVKFIARKDAQAEVQYAERHGLNKIHLIAMNLLTGYGLNKHLYFYIFGDVNKMVEIYDSTIPNPTLNFPFDVKKARARGIFISGGKQSGKTNLAKVLADYQMKQPPFEYENRFYEKTIVKVFDPSQSWVQESSIPHYQEVTNIREPILNSITGSCIFDISRMYPFDQRIFISEILGADFNFIVNKRIPVWIVYIIEEAQLVVPSLSLRSLFAQETLRTITVGRNYGMTVSLLTQFPAMVDTTTIKACGQGYFGLAWEVNDLNKLRAFVRWDKDKVWDTFPKLEVGEFVYLDIGGVDSYAQVVKTPLFKGKKPQQFMCKQQYDYRYKKKGFWERLFSP